MNLKSILIVSALGALAVAANAQVSFTGTYTQSFDSLATTGTTNVLATALPGWTAAQSGGSAAAGAVTQYRAGDGSSNAGALYSFGTGTATERALGSIGSGTPGNFVYGVTLQNTGSTTLNTFVIGYVGEQWRDGGNTTAQKISFDYKIGGAIADTTGYTAVTALDFTSPIHTATAAALNGNLAANQTVLTASITGLSLAAGQTLTIRWTDLNDLGNDHGLAVDNLRVSAQQAVPEPASMIALGVGAAAMLRRRKKA